MNKLLSLSILLINIVSVLSAKVYQVHINANAYLNITSQANNNSTVVDKLKNGQVFFSPLNQINNNHAHFYKGYVNVKGLRTPTIGKNCRVINGGTIFRVGPNKETYTVLQKNDIVTCYGNDPFNRQWVVTDKGYTLINKVVVEEQVEVVDNKEKMASNIFKYFLNKGWTNTAICGMLGNMEYESNLVPTKSVNNAYGLVQWRPASTLINWANKNNLDYKKASTQCARINYEALNNLQFIRTKNCNMTFTQYTKSKLNAVSLAKCFMTNYKQTNIGLNKREEYARNCFLHFKQ